MITIEASELEAIPGVDHSLRAHGYEVTVVPHLAAGDYLWVAQHHLVGSGMVRSGEEYENTLCCVERKRANDLISSFNDGRLQHFLENSPPGAFRCLLLHLPDSLRRVQGGLGYAGWTWQRLDAVLMSLQAEGVFIAWAVDGLCDVAERIHGLYEWTAKDDHSSLHRSIPPMPAGKYVDPAYRRQVAALMCTPGIGEELAQRLLEGNTEGVGPTKRRDAQRFWDDGLLGAIKLLTENKS